MSCCACLSAAVTWAVAIALYQSWLRGPDVRQKQDFHGVSALAIGLVALASFIPYLPGYLVCLALWWVAAQSLLAPSWPRGIASDSESGTRAGAFAPEDWADPQAFYKALERVGTPNAEIVESML